MSGKIGMFLALATAYSVNSASAKQFAPTKKEVIVVTQLDNVMLIGEDAVKIKNSTGGFELVAHAPEWNVVVFRRDNRTYWQSPLDDFSGMSLLRPFVAKTAPRDAPRPLGPRKLGGFNCTYYISKFGSTVYGASDYKISAKEAELLSRYLFVPRIPEIPLFAVGANSKKNYQHKEWFDPTRYQNFLERTPVETKSITMKKYDAADFNIPPGMKRMKEGTQVAYSLKKKHEMESIIEDVGYMTKEK